MNVLECKNSRLGKLKCIFRIIKTDEFGNEIDLGCGKKRKDVYNLYPEFDSNGDINYQHTNRLDPIKIGEMSTTIENLTQHQSGKQFDFRSFPADIHPLYSTSEFNIPNKNNDINNIDQVGEVFGEYNPFLIGTSWNIEKFHGISQVEYCQGGIYGMFDKNTNMTIHACMKSYIGLPNWKNYTYRQEKPIKKELYIGFASNDEIINFASTFFKNKQIASIMSDAMIAVKNGEFINLWTLMSNNFIAHEVKRNFMGKTSIDNLKNIYKGYINFKYFFELYDYIGKVSWIENNVTKILPKEMIKLYKENILNWILNHPQLTKITKKEYYNTNERYWWVIMLVKRALKEGILNKNAIFPQFLVDLIKQKQNYNIKLFNDKSLIDLPAEYKKEYIDSILYNLDSDKAESINNLYPTMINIKKIIQQDKDFNQLDICGGWNQFCDILKVGQRWSIGEILNCWEHYKDSFIEDNPRMFYDWLNNISTLPVDSVLMNNYDDILELGGNDFNLGDGILTSAKLFASNILDNSLYWDTWQSWEEFNVIKVPLCNWWEASAKVSRTRESNYETFYTILSSCNVLNNKHHYNEEAVENIRSGISNFDSMIETDIDSDDYSDLSEFDSHTGEQSHLNGRIGVWRAEE
ncbi:MAG: hypothetical protein M0R17_05135 [Candidatus Omnitrophica bacterium]|jgi:hypothetical protein|nr:hypothetical protein [Candidatus Omnitrophota bacterium]